jgi:hypothetical protein
MNADGDKYQDFVTHAANGLSLSYMAWGPNLYSSVTGLPHQGSFNAVYCRTNLENPMRIVDTFSKLTESSTSYTSIELRPHPALELPIEQTRRYFKVEEEVLSSFSALKRGKDAVGTVIELVGSLWLAMRLPGRKLMTPDSL